MCFELFSTGTFFYTAGVLAWFYICYKIGLFAANMVWPFMDAARNTLLRKLKGKQSNEQDPKL